LRVAAGQGLRLSLDWAHPVFTTYKRNDAGAYVSASAGRGHSNRWTFSVLKSF
jgi:hypothetical protein